jgi:general secretion pathway protein D
MPCLSFRGALPLCLAALITLTPAEAARPSPRAAPGVTLNFPAADIDAASRAMAAILNRPIVVDPRVKGTVTLYSEQTLTPAQAYGLYEAALRGLGYAVVDHAGLLTVLPEADAKLQANTSAAGGASDQRGVQGDQVMTQVFRVQHENASNLVQVLRPLISPNNTINVNPGNNTLVVTDYASNLGRLAALIAALDTPSATDVEVIPLQHTAAAELATTVQRLVGDSGGGGGAATAVGTTGGGAAGPLSTLISVDPHSNALLVRAANPVRLAAVRALVARLDRPGTAGLAGSNTHLVFLKYADATRLAQVLRAAFPALGSNGGGGGASVGTGPSSGAAAVLASTGGGQNTGSANTGASTQSTASVTPSAAPSTGGAIQADPATNSLVITAVDPQFRQLRALIDQLDSRRAQLYVESVIVEVDASKAVDVGLQWRSLFNLSSSSSLTLGTLVTALRSTAGTNILSTANLVTLDNEEAKIVVGQNVPFVTGSYTSSTSSSPFQTIERKDVGITLRLRPQIGADNTVRMTIFQESSSLSTTAATGTSNAGPTTNKRSIESTVVVDDGQFIVLGGLIEDSLSTTDDALLGLGQLPWVGGLFRSRSRSRAKSNLVVFLRPLIMRDQAGVDRPTAERYAYMRSQQATVPAQSPPTLDDDSAPSLPPLPESPSSKDL